MNKPVWAIKAFAFSTLSLSLGACSTIHSPLHPSSSVSNPTTVTADYSSRIPQHIKPGVKTVVIDPNVHVWVAYDENGNLVRSGLATAGSSWCPDIKRACKTKPGTFRVQSLGAVSCKSSIYPLPKGGAPMPYCMFFNGNQGMHGTYGRGVVEGNISHGCVRLHVPDAEWLRYNFVNIGTRVIVKPY